MIQRTLVLDEEAVRDLEDRGIELDAFLEAILLEALKAASTAEGKYERLVSRYHSVMSGRKQGAAAKVRLLSKQAVPDTGAQHSR